MQVSLDIYTTEIDEIMEIFKLAIEDGAIDVRLNTEHDYHSKQLECYNLSFEIDHNSDVLNLIDDGPFYKDRDEAGIL